MLSFMKPEESAAWQAVRGFLLPEAAELLYQYAYDAGDGAIVEIGSYAGKSTICIARACKDQGRSMIAIDKEFQPEMWINCEMFGISKEVEAMEMTSSEAADQWNESISFLYIDADKRSTVAQADVLNWDPWVIPGGIIALDTAAGFYPGPTQQLQVALKSGAYKLLADTGGISFLRKTANLCTVKEQEEILLATYIHYVSAWTGAMDLLMRLPVLPAMPVKAPFLSRVMRLWNNGQLTDTLIQPMMVLKSFEARPLPDKINYTVKYLRGIADVRFGHFEESINTFDMLHQLPEPRLFMHYKIDVRQMAGLRLAQVYDLIEIRPKALVAYQSLMADMALPEIQEQAEHGLQYPFVMPQPVNDMSLREYVVSTPLAKYRNITP